MSYRAKPPQPAMRWGHPLAPGLLFAAPLAPGDGRDIDGGRRGIVGSAVSWAPGVAGPAANFTAGAGSSIAYPAGISAGVVGSVSAMVYARTVGGGGFGRMVTQNDTSDFSLSVGNAPSAWVFTWAGGRFDGPSITLGRWVHLCGTSSGSAMSLYVDGVLATPTTGPVNPFTAGPVATNPIIVGDRAAGSRGFDGLIDAVKVWGRCLSPAEVARDADDPHALWRPAAPLAAFSFAANAAATAGPRLALLGVG